jgi:SAM-dependent methyltransferase
VEGYEANTYGDRFADVYDEWYAEVTDVDACVARIQRLVDDAGGGPVLELGVGSGRLAIPLAQRGLEVHGLDASQAMLDRLSAKPGGSLVRAHRGDMATIELVDPPEFAVVLLAFNTLFNLPTELDQQSCLARCAELLVTTGSLVVEAFVPDESPDAAASAAVEPRHIGVDEVVLRVSRSEPASQTVTGQHVHLSEAGIRLRPWFLRWATPAQLDEMAAAAGLALAWRSAGWSDEPFDHHAAVHVSCWRNPSASVRGS